MKTFEGHNYSNMLLMIYENYTVLNYINHVEEDWL